MKQIYLLIGIMLALMLCITPVAAVTGDDFEVFTDMNDKLNKYIYRNTDNPFEKYIEIYTPGTQYLHSLVTFKPANIEGAPVMVVDTYKKRAVIYLPRIVDDWEIKFYSNSEPLSHPDPDYLKNAGVVNLNEKFEKYIPDGLILELGWGQFISQKFAPWPRYSIPSVD